MHIRCHYLRERKSVFQFYNLTFQHRLVVFSLFVRATFANVACLFSLMNIIGNLATFNVTQIVQSFLHFSKAFWR